MCPLRFDKATIAHAHSFRSSSGLGNSVRDLVHPRSYIPVLNIAPASSAFTMYLSITDPRVEMKQNTPNTLLWAFITALNLYVAIAICFRLCVAQKRTQSVLSHSPFKSIAIIIVECSALITLCNVVWVILHSVNFTYGILSLGSNTEVVVRSIIHLSQVL